MKRTTLISTLLLTISVLTGGCSNVKTSAVVTESHYPEKSITMIVPFSVGGSMDLLARELEKPAKGYLGQPIMVVNKTGGAGIIGWNELADSRPDGYTLGVVGPEVVLHPLYGQTKYHYPTALEPIIQIASVSSVLAIQSKQPWNNLEELIKYAKQHPGELKFAHAGIGSISHVLGEMFAKSAGITLEQVPFRGGGEIAAAMLGGHVQLGILGAPIVKEHVKNGTVRVLAISGGKRLNDPILREVPTFKEQGIDVVLDYWYAIAAPKELPAHVKEKLAESLKSIVFTPEFKANTERLGQQLDYLSPPDTAIKWVEESQKYSKVVQETGVADLIKAQKK